MEILRNKLVSKDVARPKEDPLVRLSRKVWIRAFRTSVAEGASRDGNFGPGSWNELGRQLLSVSSHPDYAGLRFQALHGVVSDGNDPRRIIRRIPLDELKGPVPKGSCVVKRRPSGRDSADEDRAKSYLEIPVDLVECGEQICPGSADWETAYLWRLAMPQLPRLEELRVSISRLKRRLGLCTPSLSEYKSHVSPPEFSKLAKLSDSRGTAQYRDSLEPLIVAKSADAMSLLAALVAECFITDQELLLNLHREAFFQSVRHLLADTHMADIEKEFQELVAARVLITSWEQPTTYHVSSINSPFISLDRWREITGIQDWISVV